MTFYGLLRKALPKQLANISYVLFCACALILIYMFWPAAVSLFVYMKL